MELIHGITIILGLSISYNIITHIMNNHKIELLENKKDKDEINIVESKNIVEFFDNLLVTKFEYYLNTFIIAYFVSDKELEKKEIKKLKDQFFIDVSKTLNKKHRDLILKVYDEKGVELYIHQTFLRLLNTSNIKLKADSGMDNVNAKMLKEIYKG